MSCFKPVVFALLTLVMTCMTVAALAADRNCRRGDRIDIRDLDMSPDPVLDGQRVRFWKVRVRFEGRRDCQADLFIRNGHNVVGQLRDFRLRPGVNEVEIPAARSYRFAGREHCLNLQVDLNGSRQQIDAHRRFCATQRTIWSMREPEDRRQSYR